MSDVQRHDVPASGLTARTLGFACLQFEHAFLRPLADHSNVGASRKTRGVCAHHAQKEPKRDGRTPWRYDRTIA